MNRIPKIIHYCWFGGNPLSQEAEGFIASWKKYCPDFEIREWNESNFDITCNAYVREAYEAKKWAFVTDYVRLWALDRYGGIYMDTDVELLKPIDRFLEHTAFSGFENEGYIPTAIMGSVPGGEWVRLLMHDYDDRHFLLPDGTMDTTTNVITITRVTQEHYNLRLDNSFQELENVLTLYPKDYFCPKNYSTRVIELTENTHAIHHFSGSWMDAKERRDVVFRERSIRQFGEKLGANFADGLLRFCHNLSSMPKYYLWKLLTSCFPALPVGRVLVFESEGDFCDNARALYEYLMEHGIAERYRIVWLVTKPERFRDRERGGARFFTRDSLMGRYFIHRAKYLFFTHPYWLKRWKKSQMVVNLGHGFPLKGAGLDLHDTFDYLCVSSESYSELFQRFMGATTEQMLAIGTPRLDLLRRYRDVRPLFHKYLPDVDYDRFVLCMPTFRQTSAWTDSSFRNTYSINPVRSVEDLEALNDVLREQRTLLAVKIHHLQVMDFLRTVSLTNILYLTDDQLMEEDIQLYEMVGQADALLTDFSSIYFDYLLLDRPIGFFLGEIEQYSRGFVVDDPLSMMPGEHIVDLDGLYTFLRHVREGQDAYAAERKALLDKVDQYQDGDNCRRIAEYFGL